MTRKARLRPRFLPVVIAGAAGLLALKVLGLVTQGGYILAPAAGGKLADRIGRASIEARGNPALEKDADITGSTPPPKADKAKDAGKDDKAKDDKAKDDKAAKPAEAPVQPLPPALPSAAEREILEKLSERRRQLEERTKELELRETMLKSAEKMLDDKLGELKDGEAKVEASRTREGGGTPLKSLVVMYEAMKPRDAARVFEKMDARTLTTLARQMNPRKLSEILAQMTPEAAEKLTSALIRAAPGEAQAAGAAATPAAAPPPPPAAAPPQELQRLDAPAKTPRS